MLEANKENNFVVLLVAVTVLLHMFHLFSVLCVEMLSEEDILGKGDA